MAHSARSHRRGSFKKPLFATRCLLGHPLPVELLDALSHTTTHQLAPPPPPPPPPSPPLRHRFALELRH